MSSFDDDQFNSNQPVIYQMSSAQVLFKKRENQIQNNVCFFTSLSNLFSQNQIELVHEHPF